jgi:hypothetical protein
MTPQAKVSLTQGVFFTSIAKQCFQAAAACSVQNTKAACLNYASKCQFIENSVMANCRDEAAREHFKKEIFKGDTLQFGNMIDLYLRMTPEERDMLERLIQAVKDGEIIEVKDVVESQAIRNQINHY